MAGRALRTLASLALLALPRVAWAQGTADQAVTAAQQDRSGLRHVPWHDSTLVWQQRVGTQTVGVGADFQSSDPYYDWVFFLRPRYYLWENERSSLSLRGQVGASVELTDSDTTTKEHELLLDDTLLALTPEHAFVKHGEYLTDLTLSLPRVVIPTSRSSQAAGKILQLGVRALFVQAFPLREGDPFLARGYVGLRVGYDYQFANWVVPENSSFAQLRTSTEGVVVTNHQLAGAALSEHTGVLHGVVHGDLWRDVLALETEFGIDPYYRFALPENTTICNVLTGCVPPTNVDNPQRYGVLTYFTVDLNAATFDNALKVSVGYENVTNQLKLEGTRRDPLWSPDAKFYLRLEFQPDLLLEARPAAALGSAREHVASESRR